MNIVLYRNSAESIKVDKTDYLEQVAEISGTLREIADISNPVVTIDKSNINETKLISAIINNEFARLVDGDNLLLTGDDTQYINCNYAYIPEFNRFYFIDSITAVKNKLFVLTMRVDTLMTYRREILESVALVERSESDYNPYLQDLELTLSYETKKESSMYATAYLNESLPLDSWCYILTLISNGA